MKKWMSLLLAVLLVLCMSPAVLAEEQDPVGHVEGCAYINEVFGFRMVLPENWHFLSDAELAAHMGYGSEYASREGLRTYFEENTSVCGMFCVATDDAALNANFMIQDLGAFQYLDEETFLDLGEESLISALQPQGFSDIQLCRKTYRLAGADHAGVLLTASLSGIDVYLIEVMVKAGRYMGSFTTLAFEEAKAEEVLTFFEPLTEAELVLGSTQGMVYENKTLGILVTFDGSWVMLDEADRAKQMGMVTETVRDEELSKTISDALESGQSVCDMSAQKLDGSGDNVLLMLTNMGALGAVMDEEAFFELSQQGLVTSMTNAGFEICSIDPEKIDFCGKTHQSALLTCSGGGIIFYERQIYLQAGSYMGILTIFSKDRTRLDTMTAMFHEN